MAKNFLSLLVLFSLLSGCRNPSSSREIRLVHYNIKELDSLKLRQGDPQIEAIQRVFKELGDFDLLSVNEIQFDLPGVPHEELQSYAKNLNLLGEHLLGKEKSLRYNSVFFPANTGRKAGRNPLNGQYFRSPIEEGAFQEADKVNFGIFPAQYSTGLLSRFSLQNIFENSDLLWSEFRGGALDLTPYSYQEFERVEGGSELEYVASRREFDEDTIELFDKNFTDVVVELGGERVHIILLHTVPAFNFGNEEGLNVFRNAEQLRFLEWYLTGESDVVDPGLWGIKPLSPGERFIAVGDWNVDFQDREKEGAQILSRLFERFHLANDESLVSYESQDFAPDPFSKRFDYILYSSGLKLKDAGIHRPEPNRKELGCFSEPQHLDAARKRERIVVEYHLSGENTFCYVEINKKYYDVKVASDHLPLWAHFEVL